MLWRECAVAGVEGSIFFNRMLLEARKAETPNLEFTYPSAQLTVRPP